jgi:DNA-binding response OmpR family regulator
VTDTLGRLLIVDDEPPVLEVLSEFFSTQGYTVATASDGPGALAIAGRERPHLVLLDVRMPGMDGVEVLRKLRELDSEIAVIMVTANEDTALARETLKIGAFDYVSKPFDFGYLDRAVSAALLHAGAGTALADDEPAGDDAWTRLALAVFAAVRRMTTGARASTGERLESLVLDAAREASAGRLSVAAAILRQIGLLLRIARDLGDLDEGGCAPVDAALADARKSASAV